MTTSSYIQRMRSFVGHDWLLVPSAVALLERGDNELLLVRQVDTQDWSLPGGAIEFGETPLQAVVREVSEETGLNCMDLELVTVVGGPRYRVIYPNGDKVEYTSAVYRGQCSSAKEPVADGVELAEICWCPRERLADLPLISYVENLLGDIDLLWTHSAL